MFNVKSSLLISRFIKVWIYFQIIIKWAWINWYKKLNNYEFGGCILASCKDFWTIYYWLIYWKWEEGGNWTCKRNYLNWIVEDRVTFRSREWYAYYCTERLWNYWSEGSGLIDISCRRYTRAFKNSSFKYLSFWCREKIIECNVSSSSRNP